MASERWPASRRIAGRFHIGALAGFSPEWWPASRRNSWPASVGIRTPALGASPMRVVEGLWGGELPVFDEMSEAQTLVSTLLDGLWNDLARHQKRTHLFHVTRLPMEATASNLRDFGQVRMEELDGFVEGLFAGQEEIDLSERAHGAVGSLAETRAMMAGIIDLVDRDPIADDRTQ